MIKRCILVLFLIFPIFSFSAPSLKDILNTPSLGDVMNGYKKPKKGELYCHDGGAYVLQVTNTGVFVYSSSDSYGRKRVIFIKTDTLYASDDSLLRKFYRCIGIKSYTTISGARNDVYEFEEVPISDLFGKEDNKTIPISVKDATPESHIKPNFEKEDEYLFKLNELALNGNLKALILMSRLFNNDYYNYYEWELARRGFRHFQIKLWKRGLKYHVGIDDWRKIAAKNGSLEALYDLIDEYKYRNYSVNDYESLLKLAQENKEPDDALSDEFSSNTNKYWRDKITLAIEDKKKELFRDLQNGESFRGYTFPKIDITNIKFGENYFYRCDFRMLKGLSADHLNSTKNRCEYKHCVFSSEQYELFKDKVKPKYDVTIYVESEMIILKGVDS